KGALDVSAPHPQLVPLAISASLYTSPLRVSLRIKYLTRVARVLRRCVSEPKQLAAVTRRNQQSILYRCECHPLRRLQMRSVRESSGHLRIHAINTAAIARRRYQRSVADGQ